MKIGKVVSAIMLTLFLIGILTFAFNTQPVRAEPRTWYVDDDGPADFSTIQEAINAADPGDTIYVKAGTYCEHVAVNKSLTLVGENKYKTVIDGGKIGKVVTITVSNTKISGFTIQMAGFTPWGSDSGVYLKGSNNIVTENIIMNNDDWGIWLDSSSSNNTISDNNIRDNWSACMLNNASGNTLARNNITNNGYDGILLWDSSNNIISGNIISEWHTHGIDVWGYNNSVTSNNITNNLYGLLLSSPGNTFRNNVLNNNLYGLGAGGYQDIDASNTVNGKPIYYWINRVNEQVPLDAGYVALINCTNISVKNLNLKNNIEGIFLAYTNNSRIQNLNITNTEHGIYLYRSCGNIIYSSNLSNSHVGIFLDSSSGNNVILNNESKAREGIFLSYSLDNNITYNNIANNKYRGIFLGLSTDNNIAYNNITDNKMAGITLSSSARNFVHHNNFLNNTRGAQLYETWGNVFDDGYPSGGNYWSDYTGTDLYGGPAQNEPGSDGIGDIPYIIDSSNQDRYPLMKPWKPPVHDVALVSVMPSSNEVYVGNVINITVIIKNEGKTAESFLVACKYLLEGVEHLIGTQTVTNLTANSTATLTFTWTTTDITVHNIKAEIPSLTDETDIFDNVMISSTTVKVKILGDIDSNSKVDIMDLATASKAYGSYPGYPNWNPQADVNQDGKVNIMDLAIIARNFGKIYP